MRELQGYGSSPLKLRE